MSVPPTSASDGDAELAAARRAGWRKADLEWERRQEAGNAALVAGDHAEAARCFRRAGWIAFWRIPRSDPRQATTLANLALADRLAGREARARRHYAKARRVWAGVEDSISGMTIARRARSSLFHMRMEAKHWDTYQQNTRTRMAAFAHETAGALEALAEGRPPGSRLYGRWKAEKMPAFDDVRKFLSAALLVAAPGDGEGSQGGSHEI